MKNSFDAFKRNHDNSKTRQSLKFVLTNDSEQSRSNVHNLVEYTLSPCPHPIYLDIYFYPIDLLSHENKLREIEYYVSCPDLIVESKVC